MKLLPILSITIALVGISYADTTKPSTKSGAKPSVKANTKPNKKTFKPSQVDYPGFANLTQEVKKYRKSRLVKLDTFNRLASEKNTIILDTRSKWAFQGLHIKGAIHLNFSDFTEEKLAKVIPNKNTRILIYCNNNFTDNPRFFQGKCRPLALNIPTFINLYGYGYKNVYELSESISVKDKRVKLECIKAQPDGTTTRVKFQHPPIKLKDISRTIPLNTSPTKQPRR